MGQNSRWSHTASAGRRTSGCCIIWRDNKQGKPFKKTKDFGYIKLSSLVQRIFFYIIKPAHSTSTTKNTTMGAQSFIRNSIPLPRHVYEGDEYFCRFTPRIHRDVRLSDAGSWQCQVDFLKASKEARAGASRNKDVHSYAVGCINPVVGNFTALCACEALSERLALTTYMVEYAYIHDDGKNQIQKHD
jgi:hypothetical protein